MQSELIESNGLKRVYKVVIESEAIINQINDKTNQLTKTVKVSGFRPGKVPVSFVKKKYGKEIESEVLQSSISNSAQEVINENKLEPAMRPDIKQSGEFKEGENVEYTLTLEVLPEVNEVDFAKIELEKPVLKKSEKDVDEAIKKLSASQKQFEPIKRSRKARKGDKLKIDFVGKIDGEEFQGGSSEGFELELGSGQFIPGFEDQLIGIKRGEEITVKVKFPEDYHSDAYAGKDSEFEVKVHDVLEAKEVEIDDEYAKKLGLESLEKLKEELAKQIENDFNSMADNKLKKELFDELNKVCDFEVPEGMLKVEKETLEKTSEQSNQEKIENIDEIALRRVRLGILLAQIGKKEKVEITQDELSQEVMKQARAYPGQEEQFFKYYQNNPQAVEGLKGPILENKVVKIILDQVKVSDKETSLDEMIKFNQAEA